MGLLAALQFLTRLPIRLRREPNMATMVVWFPVAGAVIGLIVGGVAAGMWQVTPPLVAGGVAITVGLLVTGAFHEDGLGDVADAFGGGYTLERRLEIMQDSRHGTYGVAAMCASIVVRTVSVGSMPTAATAFASCVVAHVMARAIAVALMATVPLAGHSGLGADYGRSTTRGRAGSAVVIGVAVSAAAAGWWAGPILGSCVVAAAAVGALAKHKIDGISGDVLGACEQVAECVCLVVLSGLAAHHTLWWS